MVKHHIKLIPISLEDHDILSKNPSTVQTAAGTIAGKIALKGKPSGIGFINQLLEFTPSGLGVSTMVASTFKNSTWTHPLSENKRIAGVTPKHPTTL